MGRPSRSHEKREELLPRLAEAFAELGYRRTTTAELARRCCTPENVLYRLWPDKKAMFIAAIRYVYLLSEFTWKRLLDESGRKPAGSGDTASPAERLLEYEALHHGEFSHYRIIFAGLSETDDPEIRVALAETYRRFARLVESQISAHRRGRPAGRDDARLSAWALVGLGTVANITRELGLADRRQRRRLIREIGRLVLDSTARTPGGAGAESVEGLIVITWGRHTRRLRADYNVSEYLRHGAGQPAPRRGGPPGDDRTSPCDTQKEHAMNFAAAAINAEPEQPHRPARRWFAWISLGLLAAWAAFWLWFSISVVVSEQTTAWQPYAFIGGVIGLALLAWRAPGIGGAVMILAGGWAAVYFNNSGAQLLLALPAAVIGLMRILSRKR